MTLDPSAVGAKGDPVRRSWTSKDSLLYAVGVGAGTSELQFTTENTKDTPQRVLPTMAVILGLQELIRKKKRGQLATLIGKGATRLSQRELEAGRRR